MQIKPVEALSEAPPINKFREAALAEAEKAERERLERCAQAQGTTVSVLLERAAAVAAVPKPVLETPSEAMHVAESIEESEEAVHPHTRAKRNTTR